MSRFFEYVLVATLTVLPVFAHGPGCSCGMDPNAVTAPHGGMMEVTSDHLYAELIPEGDRLLLYFHSEDLTGVSNQEVRVGGTIRYPRNRPKPQQVAFSAMREGFEARVTIPPRVHRYTLDLEFEYRGQPQTVSFVVEAEELAFGGIDVSDLLDTATYLQEDR